MFKHSLCISSSTSCGRLLNTVDYEVSIRQARTRPQHTHLIDPDIPTGQNKHSLLAQNTLCGNASLCLQHITIVLSFSNKKGNSRGAQRNAHKVLREEREMSLRAGLVIRGLCQRLLSQGLPTLLYVVVLLHVELRSAIDIRLPKHTHCASNVRMCVSFFVCVR